MPRSRAVDDDIEGEKTLRAANDLLKLTPENVRSTWQRAFERALLMRFIDSHIAQNDTDSSRYYLGLLKNRIYSHSKNEPGNGTRFLLYSAKINAKEHEYNAAYDTLLKAYEINDSIISLKTADINNNMYVSMVAEQRSEELLASELQRNKKNLYIFAIIAILAATVISFIFYLRNKNDKVKKQIQPLNNLTQIEVAELEAHANRIQKDMGMEIHDDIVGRLVHMCNIIQNELFDERDQDRRNRIEKIGEFAKETYNATRAKSQEWYIQGETEELAGFSRSVDKIVSQILPQEKYERN